MVGMTFWMFEINYIGLNNIANCVETSNMANEQWTLDRAMSIVQWDALSLSTTKKHTEAYR